MRQRVAAAPLAASVTFEGFERNRLKRSAAVPVFRAAASSLRPVFKVSDPASPATAAKAPECKASSMTPKTPASFAQSAHKTRDGSSPKRIKPGM
jgi:hypothetical protein